MLFAVLLVAAMSLFGIASVSAADIGTAQTQTGNHHTVQKITKTYVIDLKYVKKSTKTQKNVVMNLKTVKKPVSSKNVTTPYVNVTKTVTTFNKNSVNTTNNTITQNSVPKYAYGTKKYRVYHHKWHRYHGKVHRYAKTSTHRYSYNSDVNSSSINTLARSLTSGVSSQYQKGARIFNWVRDNLSYSFYYNTRYGAAGALKYRTGNCADQAHLIVALARSAGLNARYVAANAHFRSGHWYGHVWAQIMADGKWIIADPTSNSNSFGVVRNWNSAHIKGIYNELPF